MTTKEAIKLTIDETEDGFIWYTMRRGEEIIHQGVPGYYGKLSKALTKNINSLIEEKEECDCPCHHTDHWNHSQLQCHCNQDKPKKIELLKMRDDYINNIPGIVPPSSFEITLKVNEIIDALNGREL